MSDAELRAAQRRWLTSRDPLQAEAWLTLVGRAGNGASSREERRDAAEAVWASRPTEETFALLAREAQESGLHPMILMSCIRRPMQGMRIRTTRKAMTKDGKTYMQEVEGLVLGNATTPGHSALDRHGEQRASRTRHSNGRALQLDSGQVVAVGERSAALVALDPLTWCLLHRGAQRWWTARRACVVHAPWGTAPTGVADARPPTSDGRCQVCWRLSGRDGYFVRVCFYCSMDLRNYHDMRGPFGHTTCCPDPTTKKARNAQRAAHRARMRERSAT